MAYDDVAAAALPFAEKSALAHLKRLGVTLDRTPGATAAREGGARP
jgi:hypothetical protein